MSLSIGTGVLPDLLAHDPDGARWVAQELEKVNAVLLERGLPEHHEPVEGLVDDSRAPVFSFPYAFVHHLRRATAYALRDPQWRATPLPVEADPTTDPVVDDEYSRLRSHILCHSDAEGFYLPIDFSEVIFADEEQVLGGMLGSSYRLRDELVQVAPALGIALDEGRLDDAEVERLSTLIAEEQGLWVEWMVWLGLFEAARISIRHKTAICFQ
jgi:hypothetical protein